LVVALSDRHALQLPAIDGVGARVVLDRARPLHRGRACGKGVAVDCEGAVLVARVGDRRGLDAAERAAAAITAAVAAIVGSVVATIAAVVLPSVAAGTSIASSVVLPTVASIAAVLAAVASIATVLAAVASIAAVLTAVASIVSAVVLAAIAAIAAVVSSVLATVAAIAAVLAAIGAIVPGVVTAIILASVVSTILATILPAVLPTVTTIVPSITTVVAAAIVAGSADSEVAAVLLGPTLGDGHQDRLVVGGAGHGAKAVVAGGKTTRNGDGQLSLAVAGIVDTFEEGEFAGIKGLGELEVVADILDNNVGVADDLTLAVQGLWCGVVGAGGVCEGAKVHVLELQLDVEGGKGREVVVELGVEDDGRHHVVERRNVTHGDTVAGSLADLQTIGYGLAGALVYEVGGIASDEISNHVPPR
jgi:hypothetical protein